MDFDNIRKIYKGISREGLLRQILQLRNERDELKFNPPSLEDQIREIVRSEIDRTN